MQIFGKCQVVFQEVPDEVSLAFSVAGCQLNCPGCSWSTINKNADVINKEEITTEKFVDIITKYKKYCSCVVFLGGEWDKDLPKYLKIAKSNNMKTCLYTGLKYNKISKDIIDNLDYIKVGSYNKKLGDLRSHKTNQRFFDLKNRKILNYKFRRTVHA